MEIQRIAILIWRFVGVFVVVSILPRFLARLSILMGDSPDELSPSTTLFAPPVTAGSLVGPAIGIAIGVLIYVGSRKLGALISKGV